MNAKTETAQPPVPRWHIDVEWYARSSRSFFALTRNSLCAKCQKRFKGSPDSAPNRIITAIQTCCSQNEDFFPPKLPLMETIFRIMLAGGNQPMSAEEVLQQLGARRVGLYNFSAEALARLLDGDRYYGIARV